MGFTTRVINLLVISFVLLPFTATSDLLSPLLAPLFDDICEDVTCGKGQCKASHNSTFFYECECDVGWKQTRSQDDNHFKFLPCIVPNCTLDYSCAPTPSPPPSSNVESNASFFEPCYWMDCGGGSCSKTSNFTYSCECEPGYSNLLNITAFPCFKQCAFGLDCQNLGITVLNKTDSPSPPPPVLAKNGANQVSHGKLYLLLIMMASIAIRLY